MSARKTIASKEKVEASLEARDVEAMMGGMKRRRGFVLNFLVVPALFYTLGTVDVSVVTRIFRTPCHLLRFDGS